MNLLAELESRRVLGIIRAADARSAVAAGRVLVDCGLPLLEVALVTPDAAGAIVTNSSGVRIDDNGYAVVPYVAPYRMTSVTLDPSGMSRDVELESSSQQVAPYAGAIARLEFKTTKGQALIIHALGPDGNALPFGAEVLDTTQRSLIAKALALRYRKIED